MTRSITELETALDDRVEIHRWEESFGTWADAVCGVPLVGEVAIGMAKGRAEDRVRLSDNERACPTCWPRGGVYV